MQTVLEELFAGLGIPVTFCFYGGGFSVCAESLDAFNSAKLWLEQAHQILIREDCTEPECGYFAYYS